MENKSNSNKVNRQRREKVLRFSIRKYSFGAASVAVAALMFLSGHQAVRVEAAQVSDTTEAPVIPDKEEAHTATIVDLPKTEDSLTTDKEEKSPNTAENPAETLSEKLPETSTENASENETTALDKEVVEKQTLDKTKLQANITKVQELLDKVNKEKAPASTLAAIQADLETANSVLNNNSLELTQAEIDAIAKKLNEKIFVLSSMPKINAPKKVLKEGENTIANTGSRDSRNGETMEEGSDLRSAPIDKTTKRGELGIVVANSGFITGYATPSSTIEIKKNGKTILTSKLDDTGAFKLNAPGIEVGDRVDLVVNGQSVSNTTVKKTDTVSFNDSLAGIAQVDGYTAAEADVEVSIGGRKYTTRSQSNGYFTVNVDTSLMKKDAVITTVVKKNGKEVGSGTSTVRETRTTDFGVGWNRNPMLNYSERDVFSPDTKQYAFVSKGTADKAYDNIRVYREERVEKDGNKYYYWILDSGPAANARAGSSKKISLAIPRTVGDPYDFTYTKYVNGQQTSHEEHPSATAWEHKNSNYRAYAKNGERRSGSTVNENIMSWMDYIEPSNGWMYNIYRNSRDGANRNPDAATRVNDMLGIASNGLRYHLVRGVIEDKLYIAAGQRTIITFKTKVLEGNDLDQSIMSDWVNKDKSNPMLAEIKKRLANDPYLAYGGYTAGGYDRYKEGQNAIIGTLPLKPEEAERYNLKPRAKEQSTKVGVIPDAYNSIANPNELPAGTTYRWFKDPDVSRPTAPNAPVYGKVEVIIPERGTFIVDAPVHVVDDKAAKPIATAKDNGDVTAKPQDSTKVDKIKVSFTGEDNQPKTAEGNKGTNGKWTVNNPDVRIDANNGEITIPANKVKDLTEVTAITKNGNGADSDPATAIAKDVQKPQATLNGVTLTETANTPIFTVYRGAEFNPELKVWDNSGKISKVTVGNLPGGVNASTFTAQTGKDGSSEDKKYTTRLSSGRVIDTQTLGEHIGTLHVEGSSPADSRDLKFKYRVVDITTKNLENGIAKVPVGSTLNVENSRTNVDAHNYLKVVDSNDQRDRGNSYLPQGMVWTWKSGDNPDPGTTLDNSGKYTRNAVAKFPTAYTDTNSTTRTTFAPTEIKRQVVLAVTPTAPSVVANKDGSVEITPPKRPNSNNPQDIDTITLTYTPTGKTTPETVKVTKTGNNWTVNGKPTDKVSVTPQGVVKIADLEVADGKEVTAKVSKTVDNNVVLESPVAKQNAKDAQKPTLTITPSSQTVVEGEKVEFTVTAKDNTSVTLDATDFLNKYFGRVNAGKATSTPVKTTETEKVVRISITTSAEDIGKQNTITFNAADNDGNNADPVNFNFTVTARDTVGPTITANGATVTKNEPIAPISVTAVDNPGGVGLRDKNPIEVTELPTGLTYANNRITGTPTAGKGDYPVTITAYDKNGNPTTTNITIKVQEQADKYNPRGERLTVDQNHVIEDSEVIAKVKDYAPATQLTVKSKPTTENVGNATDAVVTVTYPDGSSEDVNVPVTVRDVSVPDTEGPTITANGATVTKNEPIDPISVTAEDNPGGVGMRDNDPIVVEGLPNGLTFKDGKITGTPTAPAGDYPVTITAYDKKGNPTTTNITIKVQEQKDKYNPTAEGLTVDQNHVIEDSEVIAKVKGNGPGTVTVESKPLTATIGKVGNAVAKVTYPDGSSEEVTVPVTVKDVTGPTITAEGATVTKNEPITPIPVTVTDNEGGSGLRKENPVEVTDLPEGLTYANGEITGTPTGNKGDYTVNIKAHDKDGNVTTQTITITVQEQADKYTPKYDDGEGKPGAKVEVPVKEEAGKTIPEGTRFESLTPGITVDDKGKVTVTIPEDKEPGDEISGTIKVTYPDGSKEEVPVKVTVTTPDRDIYTPKYDDGEGKPGGTVELPLKEEDGKEIPEGTKFESLTPGITVDDKGKVTVTIPEDKNPGDEFPGTIKVTYPDGSKEEVPVRVTVTNKDKDKYTPKYEDGSGKPGTKVEVPLKEEAGKPLPKGSKFESDTPGITVDDKGNVTVTIPKDKQPGDVISGKVTVTYPDGSKDEVPVEVTVTNQDKDVYTPKYDDGSGIPGAKVEIPVTEENGKTIPEGTKFQSNTPGITVDDKGKVTVTIPEDKKPGDEITGKITVTYPDGTQEEIPVKVTVKTPDKDIYTPEYEAGNGKPGGTVELPLKEKAGKEIPEGTKFQSDNPGITVDKDGKVTVTIPEGAKPGDKITGTITVTYPDGSKDEVPVEVTVREKDKDIYTPEYDKGNGKPGGTVELPLKEKAGKEIPEGTTFQSDNPGITVDKDGKVTVTIPEGAKPGDKITGTITVTYPDGSKDEVPVEVTVREKDKDIYTPEYDKGNGKPGGTVELPLKEKAGKEIPEGTKFQSDNPGITVGKDGKVTVTIPEGAKPGDKITGTITVTYPDGSKDEVPVEVTVREKDKDIYTPEYDKGNGKPGGTVELPLKEKAGKEIPEGTTFQSDNPGITVGKDGKVTVTIPEGAKPGDKITGTITVTYPDGSKDEVPVEVTVREKDKDIYTPEYDKGNGKPGGTVELPLKEKAGKEIPEGTTFQSDNPGITVGKDGKVTVTIPEGAKPGDKITGTITVTYPDGSKDEVPVEVTVREKDKDIYTPEYDKGNGKPGGTVELPLKEKAGKEIPEGTTFQSDNPGITVDKDGKVTVTIPEGAKPGDKITGTITVTYPDGSKDEVPVEVTVREKDKDIYTPEYDKGNGKPGGTVELPLKEKAGKEIPEGTTFQSDNPGITVDKDGKVTVTIPEGAKPGDKITGTITVTYPDGSKDEVPVEVTVREKDKDIYTPEYDKGNGKPGGTVELPLKEKAGKEIPEGTTFQSDNPGITVDKDGKVTVTIPEGAKPGDKITGTITVTYPDGSKDEVPVEVTVREKDKDIYTPEYDKGNGKPGGTVELPLKEKAGKEIPEGTTFQSDNPGITVDKDGKVTVTIPEGAKPGDKITGTITVTYPDGSKDEVPVEVTVREKDKDIYTPEYDKGNGKPGGTVELPLKEKAGKEIPEGTTFQSDNPGITVDKDGKVTVTIPEGAKPGDKITGTITVTYPDGSKDEVPVEVTVREKDKDIYTPEYDKGNGKPGGTVELPLKEKAGKEIPEGTKFQSDNPGITVGKDGKVTVTIPEGAKPGDKITGTITVTYPDGSKDEVPVEVTVREKDKDIYTPEYDKGNGKPGGTVELPLKEKAGKEIPEGTTFQSDNPGITVDKDGKVTVTIPEGAKPGDKITGTITVTYPDGSKDEVPVEVTVREKDKDIYTPEYDKGNGKPGGTVELPLKEKAGKEIPEGTKFQSDNPGITVDKDGKVTVTIPEGAKPGDKITGTITVTYPDGSKDEVPVEVTVREKDKDIYTPEYDKGNGKPGTKVEIPVTPDTNGGSGQDTPAPTPAPTTPIPDAVTPNAEQVDPQTTIDNGAKSNDSQNVLPNTGTESNATLASLGLLGLLSGFGLVARKKKED